MRQRWMRLSNSRKLWISTRRNYYQTEVLKFYVTENLPPTTAWQAARRPEHALCRRDRARRRVGKRHRARADCGSAGVEPRDLLRQQSSRKGRVSRQGPIKARISFSSTNRCMGSLGDAMKSKRS